MERRSHSDTRAGCAGRPAAAILLVFLLTGTVGSAAVWAQAARPAYDHPLFTGPAHETPTPDFDQQHLRLALRFDVDRQRVFGDATLRLTPLDTSLDTLVLFAAGFDIDSVQVGEVDSARVAAYYRIGKADSLLIALHTIQDPTVPFEVRIVYSTRPRKGLYFVLPAGDQPAGQRQIWSQGEPEDNHHWFPVYDSPGDRLTSEILVTADSSWRVLSNGRRVEARSAEGGLVTTHYVQDRPHAPYLVMVALGAYETVREPVRLPGSDRPVELSYWIYPERIGDVPRTFGRTPAMMRFFAEKLRFPYPWETYAQVVLRRFHFGGMENTGATTLTDRVLLDERAALDENPDRLIAHELAHQWFGDLVTARYWTDIWLNEGFATYLSALFEAEDQGPDAFARTMLGFTDAYLEEARRYRRPLVWNRWEDPIQMFDAHSYQKGAWVLHMLRTRLGDPTFWSVLEQYLKAHAYEPVTTDHFRQALETVTGQDFRAFFAEWVEAAGHPVLDVRYAYEEDRRLLTITVAQVQEGYLVPDVFHFELPVEVQTLTESSRFRLPVDDRAQTFTFPLSSPPRFVVVDPDQEALAEIDVEQTARAWVGQARAAVGPASRIRAARALVAFQEDPALAVGLRSALAQEPSAAVRTELVQSIGRLPPSPALASLLIQAFEDQAAPVRAAVLEALGAYGEAPDVRDLAFLAAQQDRSYSVQAAAVKTLARIRSPEALDVVRSALVTPSHREVIRQAAFEALALLDVPAREGLDLALPYTEAAQPTEVRAAAAGYLGTLAPASRPALNHLIDLLDDDDVRVRRAAIEALGRVGTTAARAALEKRRTVEPQPLLSDAIDSALRGPASSPR